MNYNVISGVTVNFASRHARDGLRRDLARFGCSALCARFGGNKYRGLRRWLRRMATAPESVGPMPNPTGVRTLRKQAHKGSTNN